MLFFFILAKVAFEQGKRQLSTAKKAQPSDRSVVSDCQVKAQAELTEQDRFWRRLLLSKGSGSDHSEKSQPSDRSKPNLSSTTNKINRHDGVFFVVWGEVLIEKSSDSADFEIRSRVSEMQ